MTRGRPRQQPTRRNLELYHERVYEGRLQTAVAARFRLSSPRAAVICRQVKRWVDDALADATGRAAQASPGQRLHLAVAVRRVQLSAEYGPFLDAIGRREGVIQWIRWHAEIESGNLPPESALRLPSRAMLCGALRMLQELEDLGHVAARGPFHRLPEMAPDSSPPTETDDAASPREAAGTLIEG